MTKNQNAFETTLTAQYGPSDLVANVNELGTLTSPCYMVIEPDSDTQREVIYFDGVFGATSFVTTTTNNRYLPGSAAPSGLTHPAGATVRSVILAQHLEDIDSRIDALPHNNLTGLTTGDPHTQYVLGTTHVGAGSHDALNISAGSLQSVTLAQLRTEIFESVVSNGVLDTTDYGNPDGTWNSTQGTVTVTIPTSWSSYDLIVSASKQMLTAGVGTHMTRFYIDQTPWWSDIRNHLQGSGVMLTHESHFSGLTATGLVTINLRIRNDYTPGEVAHFTPLTVLAHRTS